MIITLKGCRRLVITLVLILDLSAIALAAAIPAHGLTMAMCLTLMGVLNYVAYGGIFEGRKGGRLMSNGEIETMGSPRTDR